MFLRWPTPARALWRPRSLWRGGQSTYCTNDSKKPTTLKALSRRFYKLVHPDRFAQFPEHKATNERSLKLLMSLINSLSETGAPSSTTPSGVELEEPTRLTFYLRPRGNVPQTDGEAPVWKSIEAEFNPRPSRPTGAASTGTYHLQEQLKRTLSHLFQQAGLPCDFQLDVTALKRDDLWDQMPSEVDLMAFLRRFGDLARERAMERASLEKEIYLLRTAFRFRSLTMDVQLPHMMYQQNQAIDVPLAPVEDTHVDFVDPMITPFSASTDIYGDEFVRVQLKLLQQLVQIADHAPRQLHQCTLCFSDETVDSLPFHVDQKGRIHLHYQASGEDWLAVLRSVEYDQLEQVKAQQRDVRSAEGSLAHRFGVAYISANSSEASTSMEYQAFLQRLIEASNKNLLTNTDFQSGLYQRMGLVVVPSEEAETKEKHYTGDSHGLIVPADCTVDRLKQFISNHAARMRKVVESNTKLEAQETQLIHQLKRRLRLRGVRRDRQVSRQQMLHFCINLRSIRNPALTDGLSLVSAQNLLRVMDDGTFIVPWNFAPEITFN